MKMKLEMKSKSICKIKEREEERDQEQKQKGQEEGEGQEKEKQTEREKTDLSKASHPWKARHVDAGGAAVGPRRNVRGRRALPCVTDDSIRDEAAPAEMEAIIARR